MAATDTAATDEGLVSASGSAATAEQVALDVNQGEDAEAIPETVAEESDSTEGSAPLDTFVDEEHLAAASGEGETIPSTEEAHSNEAIEDRSASSIGSTTEPALVATAVDAGVPAAPVTDSTTPAPSLMSSDRAPKRHPVRQQPQPTAHRPIRDRLGAALAAMPRPLGLLPQPESVAQRRPTATRPTGATAPRALATKSIGTRPLETTVASPDISQAIGSSAPAQSDAGDAATTLTAGNDLEASKPAPESVDSIDAGTEPATLAVDTPEDSNDSEGHAPRIEVTLTGPEEATPLGERVTLHLSIKNTGTAAATSVTPVMHFGIGLEPLGIRGRNGHFTGDGSVMFDRLAELPAGEGVDIEIVAVCTGAGTISYQGVAWCGDGETRELVPANASITVSPASLATEPTGVPRR